MVELCIVNNYMQLLSVTVDYGCFNYTLNEYTYSFKLMKKITQSHKLIQPFSIVKYKSPFTVFELITFGNVLKE